MGLYKIAKYAVVITSGVLFAAGSVFLAAALYLRFNSGLFENEVVDMFDQVEYSGMKFGTLMLALTYTMMGVGATIMVVAMVGIVGAYKKNAVLAIVTTIMVMVMLGFWMSVKIQSDDWVYSKMVHLIKEYHGPQATDTVSKGWNVLFIEGHCCGLNGGSSYTNDFIGSNWAGTVTAEHVPATCCQGVDNTYTDIAAFINTAKCTLIPKNYYTKGCYNMIRDYIIVYSLIVFICGSITLVLEIMSTISVCLIMDFNMNRVGFRDVAAAAKKQSLRR